MSRRDSELQKLVMSWGYRGKEIFKPLNTGRIDERTACVREWVANIFFYTKNGTTVMIDAGYNYPRLGEKMAWLGIDPASVRHILITHQDTDHIGAVETDSDGLFRGATLYLSEEENRYLTGRVRRRVCYGLGKLSVVRTENPRVLLRDGQVLDLGGIRVECLLVPGHTWGHMVYLIDNEYLFTGDALWFGADGGYSFIDGLAEDNGLAVRSLAALEEKLRARSLAPKIITGHTGWTDNMDFAFAHREELCHGMKKQKPHDPKAPYDGYDEADDTEERAKTVPLEKQDESIWRAGSKPAYANWMPESMVVGAAAGAGVLLAGGCAASRGSGGTAGKLLGAALLTGAAGCGAFAVYAAAARRAFSYDGKRQLSRRIVEGTAAAVTLPAGGVGLDVGCGSGALTIACAKRNPQGRMVGCDVWSGAYRHVYSRELCVRNAAAEGVSNVRFMPGNAVKLPFADESFDAVTSNYVYHNISGHNKQQLLKETLRVLKKGGVFAIHDLMGPARYGDMEAFVRTLREQGYEQVRLMRTTDGSFMGGTEGKLLGLGDSMLLTGRK